MWGAPGTQPGKLQIARLLQRSPGGSLRGAPGTQPGVLEVSVEITWSAGVQVSMLSVKCMRAREDAAERSLRELREGPSQARAWALKFANACASTDWVARCCAKVPSLRLLGNCWPCVTMPQLLLRMALRSKMVVSELRSLCKCAAASMAVKDAAVVVGSHGAASCRAGTGERERWRWERALGPFVLASLRVSVTAVQCALVCSLVKTADLQVSRFSKIAGWSTPNG